MVNVHGLAASIRSAQESEVFDLAGQNVSTIQQTIQSAFAEPFDIEEMIRITLITGAGKLGRQRYDDGAARAVTSILTQLGFEEDRGASGTLDCAGTFKMQHDTGKNLKTIVIYPKINVKNNGTFEEEESAIPSLIPVNSPDYKIAMSSMATFRNMITKKCPTWTDKKGCLTCIENLSTLLQKLEDKLCKGTILDPSEQDFYDKVTALEEKETYIKKVINDQIFEKEQITQKEKDILVKLVSEKITSLKKENKSVIKTLQRKEALLDIEPIQPYPLKHENEIRKVVKDKLLPIQEIEVSSKGRLLTIKETQILSQKDDVLDLIAQYEIASRGWFEDEDVFQSRLEHSRQQRKSNSKKNKKVKTATSSMKTTSSSSASSSSNTVNKWILPGSTKTQQSSKKWNKTKIKGPDVFSAMLMDSSDDDDDDESSEEEEEIKQQTTKVIAEKPLSSNTKPKKINNKNSKQESQQQQQQKKKTNNATNTNSNVKKDVNTTTNTTITQSKKSSKEKTSLTSATQSKQENNNNSSSHNTSPLPKTNDGGGGGKSSNKKKKKSKKKNKSKENNNSDELFETSTTQVLKTPDNNVTTTQVSEKSENKPQHIVIVIIITLYEIIRDYLIPLLLTILAWIIGMLFGTNKKNKNKGTNKKR